MTLDCEKSSKEQQSRVISFVQREIRKKSGPKAAPTHSVYQMKQAKVNKKLCIINKFSVLNKWILFDLYNIPSCKPSETVVSYRYKDSSSKEEKDETFPIIFRLNKFVTSNKMNVPGEFKFRQRKVSSDPTESEVTNDVRYQECTEITLDLEWQN